MENMKKLIFSILLLLEIPFGAHASAYVAFDLNPIPVNCNFSDCDMLGTSPRMTIELIATSPGRSVRQIELPFCRSGGTSVGNITLEVRTTASTSPNVVASSTIAGSTVSSSALCNNLPAVNATTSIFQLNNALDYEVGTSLYFTLRFVGTSGTYLISGVQAGTTGEAWANDTPMGPGWSISGIGTGILPQIYNASSSAVVCDTFDIGCYISTGFLFLFYPEDWTFDQLTELQDTLASSTPFGYGYELVDTINTALNTATGSFAITADLSDFGTMFQNATSVPIVSSEGIITFAGDDWDLVQGILAGGFYLILLSYFWFRFFNTI